MDNYLLGEAGNLTATRSELEIPEQSTLGDLLQAIGLRSNLISFAAVNGVRRAMDYRLKDKDKVALYPYIIGG